MHAHVFWIEDRSTRVALLAAMADYAAAEIGGESALQTARDCLTDALGRGFDSLRDPECASRIGPIVPGALMPGGARVPGTSLELDPAQAAYCISLMLCQPGGGDQWPGPGRTRAADPLGAILAVADYQARRAIMEGKPPPRVRDLLLALLKSLEIQCAIAALDETLTATGVPLQLAGVAAAAVIAAQLGGTRVQIVRAVSCAAIDSGVFVDRDDSFAVARSGWAWADTMGRAVRHACQALAPVRASFLTPGDLNLASLAGSLLGAAGPTPKQPFGTAFIDQLAGVQKPEEGVQVRARFRTAVDRAFPPRQAERIKALFAAPERLDDLPVNELMAALVTNGAR
jgi:hypothetical protein